MLIMCWPLTPYFVLLWDFSVVVFFFFLGGGGGCVWACVFAKCLYCHHLETPGLDENIIY